MPLDDTDLRKQRERDFHDQRFTEETRRTAGKYYDIDAGKARYRDAVMSLAGGGASVLEYGCGQGSMAFELSDRGAEVVGIDISSVAIHNAEAQARRHGSRATFRQMDAESLDFADDSFDLVCGSGILHHLDLERAIAEVARVTVPSGTAVFMEPLGHNPLINAYRALTPRMRTDDEHPLRVDEIRIAEEHFGRVVAEPFNLAALAAVPVRSLPGGARVVAALHRLDRRLFRASPWARRWAWVTVITLCEPRPRSDTPG